MSEEKKYKIDKSQTVVNILSNGYKLERSLFLHGKKIGVYNKKSVGFDISPRKRLEDELRQMGVLGETVCSYDEGFISGVLSLYSGKPYTAVEVDCWATGDRVCRFCAEVKEQP